MVDQRAISDMKNIQNILNGKINTKETSSSTSSKQNDDNYIVEDMKNILQKLNSTITDTIKEDLEDEFVSTEIKSAYCTEKTDNGARIGTWEIRINHGSPTTYDVVSVNKPHIIIAENLYLSECAYGLIKHLNNGATINDSRIKQLLEAEDSYVKNRNDAAHYKSRFKSLKQKDDPRAPVVEDRYDVAKSRAENDYSRILELAGIRY